MLFLLFGSRRGPYRSGDAARRSILEAVRTHPGLSRSEIIRLTGLGWGAVAHHVRSMVERGELRVVHLGRRPYFHVEEGRMELFPVIRLLRTEGTATELLRVLNRNGAFTLEELSRQVPASKQTLRRQLNRFLTAGLVQRAPTQRVRFELRSVPLDARPELESDPKLPPGPSAHPPT